MATDGDLDVKGFGGAGDRQQLGLCVVGCQTLAGHPVDDFVYIVLQGLDIRGGIDWFE